MIWKHFLKIFLLLCVLISFWIIFILRWSYDNSRKFNQSIEPKEETTEERLPYPQPDIPWDDYGKLIDLKNFEYIIDPKSCKSFNSSPLLLILVHSAPKNFFKRETIRETWGKISSDNNQTQLLFLLGSVDSPKLQEIIEIEREIFGDLVQGNFHDSYRNLTYKTVMALKWFTYKCPDANFLLRVDDDVRVDVEKLLKLLRNERMQKNQLIYCKLNEYVGPVIREEERFAVTYEEYSGEFFPRYCQGHAVVFSKDVIAPLYIEAQNLPYFWIEDIQVTGIAREKLSLKLTSKDAEKYFELLHSQ